MKTELKTNTFIEGFDTEEAFRSKLYGTKGIRRSIELIYQGKTDEVTREIVEDYILINKGAYLLCYRNYGNSHHPWFRKIQESIQSAVTENTGYVYPFIVIYKNKQQ